LPIKIEDRGSSLLNEENDKMAERGPCQDNSFPLLFFIFFSFESWLLWLEVIEIETYSLFCQGEVKLF